MTAYRKGFELIVARDIMGAIGINNELPWKVSSDLAHFKNITMGKTMVMGGSTYRSLGSKPLPKRKSVVLTRDSSQFEAHPDVVFFDNINDLVKHCNEAKEETIVIGGAAIYRELLPYVTTIHESWMDIVVQGADTFFPDTWFAEFNKDSVFTTERKVGDTCAWLYRIWNRKY